MPKRGGGSGTDAESGTVGGVRGSGAGVGRVAVAVLGLRGRGMARDGLIGVGGGVELEVLRVVRRLWLGVELCHFVLLEGEESEGMVKSRKVARGVCV